MPDSFALEVALSPALRDVLEEVYKGRVLYPFPSGHSIEMLPHEVWVVCRGIVQLGTLYDTGDEALLGLACSAMPFGLPLTLIRPYHAIALTDVDLMRLTMGEIEQSPLLAQGMFRHIVRRIRQAEAILAMVGYRRVEDRLRHLLILLRQEIGCPTSEGTRLGVRLTHQQLANAIGTTRVTVTRLLNQMREEGWLFIDRNRYIVIPPNSRLDPEALERS